MSDSELLQRFARQNDQAAFTELTRRHLALVYAAALRHVDGDAHAAQDIAQQVFIDLARKARTLSTHPCLAGWLYASTRFTALHTLRGTRRRTVREREVQLMTTDASTPANWDQLRPVIDDALQELNERDREFVLLRFFGQQSFATIAQQCAVTENAAQKAVSRALDLLNAALTRRGITSTAAALATVLTQSAATVPTTLLGSVTAAAFSAGSAMAPSASLLAAAKVVAVLGLGAIAGGGLGYWTGTQRQLEASARETAETNRQLATERRAALEKLRDANNRATVAETETATLLQAIERARSERAQAVATAAAAKPASPSGPTQPYSVKPGDSVMKIARGYGLSLPALRDLNQGVEWSRLTVGQVIKLPEGAKPVPADLVNSATIVPTGIRPSVVTYFVSAGDTLSSIANSRGVSADDLRSLNPSIDWSRLSVGQVVRVK